MAFEMPDQLESAVAWASSEKTRGAGVYWAANPLKDRARSKCKASDVLHAALAHADIDPDIDTHGGFKAARSALTNGALAQLRQGEWPASVIIDSGNGLQALWLYEQSEGDLKLAASINKRLCAAVHGDPGTHDVARLLRLPGTWNHPNQSKLRKGYPSEPSLASVLHCSDVR